MEAAFRQRKDLALRKGRRHPRSFDPDVSHAGDRDDHGGRTGIFITVEMKWTEGMQDCRWLNISMEYPVKHGKKIGKLWNIWEVCVCS